MTTARITLKSCVKVGALTQSVYIHSNRSHLHLSIMLKITGVRSNEGAGHHKWQNRVLKY